MTDYLVTALLWPVANRKEIIYLTMQSTHFIYGYIASDYMVKDYSDSKRGNLLPHQGYFFQLAARVLLYAPFHRQDSTYHGLCYISCEALAGTFAKACHKMQILAMNLNKSHRINFSNMQIKMQKTFIIHDVVMYKLFYTQINLNLSQTSVTYYSDTQ